MNGGMMKKKRVMVDSVCINCRQDFEERKKPHAKIKIENIHVYIFEI